MNSYDEEEVLEAFYEGDAKRIDKVADLKKCKRCDTLTTSKTGLCRKCNPQKRR